MCSRQNVSRSIEYARNVHLLVISHGITYRSDLSFNFLFSQLFKVALPLTPVTAFDSGVVVKINVSVGSVISSRGLAV